MLNPRRPPQHPQFRGMIWREAQADRARADDPLAEWGYIVPGYPEGLERSRLRDATPLTQQEVVLSWFLANFSPLNDGGSWSGYASGAISGSPVSSGPIGGGGPARYAPEVRTPEYFLEEEFSSILPPDTLAVMAAEFKPRSAFWFPTPPVETLSSAPNDALVKALNRLAEAIERLPIQPPGVGHNSGQAAPIGEIANATATALEAVSEGAAGRPKGEQARSRLQITLDKIVEGAAAETGRWAFRTLVEHILPYLWDAIAALSHWIDHWR